MLGLLMLGWPEAVIHGNRLLLKLKNNDENLMA